MSSHIYSLCFVAAYEDGEAPGEALLKCMHLEGRQLFVKATVPS
jgi:hypothetical protein